MTTATTTATPIDLDLTLDHLDGEYPTFPRVASENAAPVDYVTELETQRDTLQAELQQARAHGRPEDEWTRDRVESLEWTLAELARVQ